MKHTKKGSETLDTLQNRLPERKTIDGVVYISFRDVFYNLLVNNLKKTPDYSTMAKKAQTYIHDKEARMSMSAKERKQVAKETGIHPMSPRHIKRMEKQLKKMSGVR
jgi:hypothetical protein